MRITNTQITITEAERRAMQSPMGRAATQKRAVELKKLEGSPAVIKYLKMVNRLRISGVAEL